MPHFHRKSFSLSVLSFLPLLNFGIKTQIANTPGLLRVYIHSGILQKSHRS